MLYKNDFYLEERFNLIAEAIDKSGKNDRLFLSKLVFSLSNELCDNKKLLGEFIKICEDNNLNYDHNNIIDKIRAHHQE